MAKAPSAEELRTFVRSRAVAYLRRDNVTSVGVGYKIKSGLSTGQLSIQFTVSKKFSPSVLESMGEEKLPGAFSINGIDVPTDVLERRYCLAYQKIANTRDDPRKLRHHRVTPGISIGSAQHTGTLGAIVFDNKDGAACVLSNWHVLQGNENEPGAPVYQPGPRDDGELASNRLGSLVRGYVGEAGDFAIAKIDSRKFAHPAIDLKLAPARVARAELDDRVVKVGRTTGVTYGIVSRVDVITVIDYGDPTGLKNVGGFEIKPDPRRLPKGGEISSGGDSGAVWLAVEKGKPTDVMLGVHFAGEAGEETSEHALACYAHSTLMKLNVSLSPPTLVESSARARAFGFDVEFLGRTVPPPKPIRTHLEDAVFDDDHPLLRYTHFSILMSRSRKIARYGAWNIDGAQMVKLGKANRSDTWKFDDRADGFQLGPELYDGTVFDKGHICKREDLVWGTIGEARAANNDSFTYTNCSPQHNLFNRGSREVPSIWKGLEDEIIGQAAPRGIRLSVFAGPVLRENDRLFAIPGSDERVQIPQDFWKVVVYVDDETSRLVALGFLLTQKKLLTELERLDLTEYAVYQRPLSFIEAQTGLRFGLSHADPKRGSTPEALGPRTPALDGEVRAGSDIDIGRAR